MATEKTTNKSNNAKPIRKGVFWPSFIVIGGAALLGIVNNEMLTKVATDTFYGLLEVLDGFIK